MLCPEKSPGPESRKGRKREWSYQMQGCAKWTQAILQRPACLFSHCIACSFSGDLLLWQAREMELSLQASCGPAGLHSSRRAPALSTAPFVLQRPHPASGQVPSQSVCKLEILCLAPAGWLHERLLCPQQLLPPCPNRLSVQGPRKILAGTQQAFLESVF